jgi:2-hydroxychromene-2-carboxylate isomerase
MIDGLFDCARPWTWLACRQLRRRAAERDLPVAWLAVLVERGGDDKCFGRDPLPLAREAVQRRLAG